MSKAPHPDEVSEIVPPFYCHLWLQLARPPSSGMRSIVPLMFQTARVFGVAAVQLIAETSCSAGDAAGSSFRTDQPAEALAHLAIGAERDPLCFETPRPDSSDRRDLLFRASYFAKTATDASGRILRHGPMLCISARFPDPHPTDLDDGLPPILDPESMGPDLDDDLHRLIDLAARLLPIASGFVEITSDEQDAGGAFYLGKPDALLPLDRLMAWAVWTAPPCDPTRQVFRLGSKTLLGPEITRLLTTDLAAFTAAYAEVTGPCPKPRVRPLADGGMVVSVDGSTNEEIATLSLGWSTQYRSFRNPSGWLYWKLREKNLIV